MDGALRLKARDGFGTWEGEQAGLGGQDPAGGHGAGQSAAIFFGGGRWMVGEMWVLNF